MNSPVRADIERNTFYVTINKITVCMHPLPCQPCINHVQKRGVSARFCRASLHGHNAHIFAFIQTVTKKVIQSQFYF